MIRVGVSGAAGRMGRLVVEAVAAAPDLEAAGLYAPGHGGETVAGLPCSDRAEALAGAEVVVEFSRPDVVLGNLVFWKGLGAHAVVGTSGFDAGRVDQLRGAWGSGPPNCLVVPNFSLGAVLMMRFAEQAAPYFAAAEVVELHHDRKADAPSGTALSTAERIGAAQPNQRRRVESTELVSGARGGARGGVPVHSVRLPGLRAHQEVLLGNDGELLTIRHDATDDAAYLPGILLAIRAVGSLPGVTVGLETLLT